VDSKIKNFCVAILALTLAVCAAVLTPTLHRTLKEVQDTAIIGHATADKVGAYVDDQIDIVRSPAYQNNFRHASELGKVATESVVHLDRQITWFATKIAPRVEQNMDDLHSTQGTMKSRIDDLGDFIRAGNKSLNEDIVPKVVAVIGSLGDSVDDVQELVNNGSVTIGDLDKIVKNENVPRIVTSLASTADHVDKTSAHLEGITASADTGMQKFPDLMDNFQKYAKASTVWQKRLYLAKIIRELAAIPLRLP
jgi:ABC-type transporter Mla subunit MlaD